MHYSPNSNYCYIVMLCVLALWDLVVPVLLSSFFTGPGEVLLIHSSFPYTFCQRNRVTSAWRIREYSHRWFNYLPVDVATEV